MPNTDISTPTNAGRSTELSISEQHRLLQSEDRRLALDVVSERRLPIELDTLAAAVAERADEHSSVTSLNPTDLAIVFHHIHLPLMERLDIVEYDATTNQIVSVQL